MSALDRESLKLFTIYHVYIKKYSEKSFEGKKRNRLRVVSKFCDGDCGAGKIHTCAREISRRRDAKFRARTCVFCPAHNRHRQS